MMVSANASSNGPDATKMMAATTPPHRNASGTARASDTRPRSCSVVMCAIHPSSAVPSPYPMRPDAATAYSHPPPMMPTRRASMSAFPKNTAANAVAMCTRPVGLRRTTYASAVPTMVSAYAMKNSAPNALPAPCDRLISWRNVLEIMRGNVKPHTMP